MTKGEKTALSIVAAYILMGLFTWGHAHNRYMHTFQGEVEGNFRAGMGGMLAGIVWPVYWSCRLQATYPDETLEKKQ